MNHDPLFIEHLRKALTLFEQGKDIKFIEDKIASVNIDPLQKEIILKQIKRLWHVKRNKIGTQLIIVGIIFLGIGFISSILLHLNGSNSLDFPLYGLTATGIVILIIGLVYLFH